MGISLSNPFTPRSGGVPPMLIQRQKQIDVFTDILDGSGDYSPNGLRISGPRCSGKTSLALSLDDVAYTNGWCPIFTHGNAGGILHRLTSGIQGVDDDAVIRNMDDDERQELVDGFIDAATGFLSSSDDEYGHEGIVAIIDDAKPYMAQEICDLCDAISTLNAGGMKVVLVITASPYEMKKLVADVRLSFLRDMESSMLSLLDSSEIALSLRETLRDSGVQIEYKVADELAKATFGFPMLVQYIGSSAYEIANDTSARAVSLAASNAKRAIDDAYRRYQREVLEPPLMSIPNVEQCIILAMNEDDKKSKVADILARTNISKSDFSRYRARLIDCGMVDVAGHGYLTYALPLFAAWMQIHKKTLTNQLEEKRALKKWQDSASVSNPNPFDRSGRCGSWKRK